MKKIQVKTKSEEHEETPILSSEAVYHANCEECEKEITFSHSDIEHGAYGCVKVLCPHCHKRTYVYCPEEDLVLTKENLKFPQHFSQTESKLEVSDAEIEEHCKKLIQRVQSGNPFAQWSYGNVGIVALGYEDEIVVNVFKDYSETSIPNKIYS